MVEEHMKVLPSASVSQPFYTEILISHFGRKIWNALNAVSLFFSSHGNTTPWTWMLPVRVFRSFIIYALPPQGRETLDKFVFINWISEKSITKKTVNLDAWWKTSNFPYKPRTEYQMNFATERKVAIIAIVTTRLKNVAQFLVKLVLLHPPHPEL